MKVQHPDPQMTLVVHFEQSDWCPYFFSQNLILDN